MGLIRCTKHKSKTKWDEHDGPIINCPDCIIEKEPTKILLKDPLKTCLMKLDEVIRKYQREKDLMVAGYLIALGQDSTNEVIISPDYTFLTLIKKEEKEDGKDGN